MEKFTKPSIIRVARKAGIKNLSEECYTTIRHLINMELNDLLNDSFIINEERGTKTLMADDVLEALKIRGVYLSKSEDLSTETCEKH